MTWARGLGPSLGQAARLHGRAFHVADWTDPAHRDSAALAAWRRLNGDQS